MAAEIVLRVKASSSVPSLGSAIAHAVYDEKDVTLRAIGAGAISTAVKAIAVARGFVAPRGYDLSCRPGFFTTTIEGEEATGLLFKIDVI
jgi:stage V sporulation protein S